MGNSSVLPLHILAFVGLMLMSFLNFKAGEETCEETYEGTYKKLMAFFS